MFGIKMRMKDDVEILELITQESIELHLEDRHKLRQIVKENIQRIQEKNRKTASKVTKPATVYKEGELVAIQRTQYGTGIKISPKFYGSYEVTKVKRGDRYEVARVGQGDGPERTSTAADFMKPYPMPTSGTEGQLDMAECGKEVEEESVRGKKGRARGKRGR